MLQKSTDLMSDKEEKPRWLQNADTSDEELPRVLVSTPYPFNTETGGGITLRSLFQGWPKNRLAQVYGMGHSRDSNMCDNYFLLNESSARWTSPSPIWRMRRFAPFILGQNEVGAIWARLTSQLMKFVRDFQPEIIFTQLGTLLQIRLAMRLAEFAGVPLAVHVADDWANGFHQGKDPVNRYLHHRLEKEFREALEVTAVRWGMSLPMAQAYRERYGGEWGHIYNPIFVERWPERSAPKSTNGKFRVLYSGSIIGGAQKRSLTDICDAVAGLGAEGMEIEMNIYTFAQYLGLRAELERPPYVRMHEQAPYEKLPEHLASADLLVLPVNFDQESINYIRYSMPGKVSEYLLSGTPTLVYGPGEVVPVEYAQREGWGEVITQQGIEGVMKAIRDLAADPGRRAALARRAREVGLKNHDAKVIRARFRHEISQAVIQTKKYERGSRREECETRSFA